MTKKDKPVNNLIKDEFFKVLKKFSKNKQKNNNYI